MSLRCFPVALCFQKSPLSCFNARRTQPELYDVMRVGTSSYSFSYERKLGFDALERQHTGEPSPKTQFESRDKPSRCSLAAESAGSPKVIEARLELQSVSVDLS